VLGLLIQADVLGDRAGHVLAGRLCPGFDADVPEAVPSFDPDGHLLARRPPRRTRLRCGRREPFRLRPVLENDQLGVPRHEALSGIQHRLAFHRAAANSDPTRSAEVAEDDPSLGGDHRKVARGGRRIPEVQIVPASADDDLAVQRHLQSLAGAPSHPEQVGGGNGGSDGSLGKAFAVSDPLRRAPPGDDRPAEGGVQLPGRQPLEIGVQDRPERDGRAHGGMQRKLPAPGPLKLQAVLPAGPPKVSDSFVELDQIPGPHREEDGAGRLCGLR
jgi:hypothetical protein